ncbi:hypothetical protein Tco_0344628 [Tanacetum coccineum]
MLDSAETKTASKISQSKGTFNSTHDEFLNRFPSRNIEEIRDLDKKVTTRSEMVIDLDADERVTKLMKCGAKHAKQTHSLLFLVLIRVIDESGSTFFILFVREVSKSLSTRVQGSWWKFKNRNGVYTVFKMIDDKHVIDEVLHNESVNDHYGINVGSSDGFGGVKDAFSVTGENKTHATVEKDNATGLDKRHWSLFTSHTLMTPKT